MTLIKTTSGIKSHVNININFDWNNVEPFVKQAERQYIKSLIGADLYNSWESVSPTTGVELLAYKLFEEASANLSMLKYIPQGNVNVSDNGIQNNSNEFTKPAEWWQIRDLQRAYESNGLTAIDEALKLMEDNESDFSEWIGTEGYTVFKELYTSKTQDFQRYFNINSSRRVFLSLRPYILESQEQIFNWLDNGTIAVITAHSTPEANQALKYMQAAQVNFTVAKAASSGVFLLKSSGMFTRSEEASLSNTKIDKLSEEELMRLKNDRITAGEEYLKKLKKVITDNPDIFPDYSDGASSTPSDTFINTKSIVSF